MKFIRFANIFTNIRSFLTLGALRGKRDSQLEEPYRSWINREVSIPADVIFLPRKINVPSEAMLVIAVLIGCATMTFLFLPGALKSFHSDVSTDSSLVITLVALANVLLPFWTIRRLSETLRARLEQRRGKLRQGIFVGTAGILVRLTPNKCFALPLEKFMRAKHWSGSENGGGEFICIETKDGNIDFSERSLAVDAEAVNQSVFEARVLRSSIAKNQRKGK